MSILINLLKAIIVLPNYYKVGVILSRAMTLQDLAYRGPTRFLISCCKQCQIFSLHFFFIHPKILLVNPYVHIYCVLCRFWVRTRLNKIVSTKRTIFLSHSFYQEGVLAAWILRGSKRNDVTGTYITCWLNTLPLCTSS